MGFSTDLEKAIRSRHVVQLAPYAKSIEVGQQPNALGAFSSAEYSGYNPGSSGQRAVHIPIN